MAGFTRFAVNVVSFLIIIQQICVLQVAGDCPKGFKSVDKYCYFKKGPETFSEKFSNCPGNLFTLELEERFGLLDSSFWTDYTTLLPGSVPLVDWSYTNSTGTILNTAEFRVAGEYNMNVDIVNCVIKTPTGKLALVGCNERHYRCCVVEAGNNTRKYENVTLTVIVKDGNIELSVDYLTPRGVGDPTLHEEHIMCFTDSSEYFPQRVSFSGRGPYKVTPLEDGYYWCTHSDSKNFYKTESRKVLYIKNERDLLKTYAVKIKCPENYILHMEGYIDDGFVRLLIDNIFQDYVFYAAEYRKSTKKIEYNISDLIKFKNDHPSIVSDLVVLKTKVKRVYRDYIVGHVELNKRMAPLQPGLWGELEVEYMKPAYFCGMESKPLALGSMRQESFSPCKYVACEGDFNEGVKMTTDLPEVCIRLPTRILDATTRTTNLIEPKNLDLEDVIIEIEHFLNYPAPFTINDFAKGFYQVDDILFRKDLEINSHFLKLLEEIGARIDLDNSLELKAVGKNIALLVTETSPKEPLRAFRVADRETDLFTIDAFEFFHTEINATLISESDIAVILPSSVSSLKRRVSVLVFRNNHPFQERSKNYEVNSRVFSVKVDNYTNVIQGEVIDIYMKPLKRKQKRSQSRTCAFWQFHDDNTGSWSQEGCNFTRALQMDQLDICTCNHLTHFAEILVPRSTFSKIHETTLEYLSVIGCCVSILGLLLVSLTAALFRSWRRDFINKIWLQLSISILILSFCFLIKVYVQFEEDDYFCPLTGIMLHYSVLSSFCWMLVAAVVSYRKLVAVMSTDPTHKLLRASVFAWGLPLAVVCILLSVAPHSYDGQLEKKLPSEAFYCYPSGLALWLAVFAPIALMLLSNLTLFVLIVRSVFGKRRPQYHKQNEAKEAIRCASVSCLLVFLLGLPWLFGLLSSNIVCAYLFTIFVTFQGFVLCFFFVGKKTTRDLWLVKLKLKQIEIPVAVQDGVPSYHYKEEAKLVHTQVYYRKQTVP